MSNQTLSVNEKQVLQYLQSLETPVVKSNIGIAVGKRIPKNAATWANPILDKLIEKGLVEQVEEGAKILYKAKENFSEQIITDEPEDEIDVLGAEDNYPQSLEERLKKDEELRNEFPANIEGSKEFNKTNELERLEDEKLESESPAETLDAVEKSEKKKRTKKEIEETGFSLPKAKKWILQKATELIENKGQWESKGYCISKALSLYVEQFGEIPEEYFQRTVRPITRKLDPRPRSEKGLPRRNMLDRFDREHEKQKLSKEWERIKDSTEMTERGKKSHLIKFIKDSLITRLPNENSIKANSTKSLINTLIHEVTTGTERIVKNDGREFVLGQKVKYKDRNNNEKIGKIVRIFDCMNAYQRTIVVVEDGGTKPEMKIDRKIIEVVE